MIQILAGNIDFTSTSQSISFLSSSHHNSSGQHQQLDNQPLPFRLILEVSEVLLELLDQFVRVSMIRVSGQRLVHKVKALLAIAQLERQQRWPREKQRLKKERE
jgi:hypothetical protein